MNKLDSWVDPADVVAKGSQYQHTVRAVRLSGGKGEAALVLAPLDAGVMNPVTASRPAQIFQQPASPMVDKVTGFASQLMQNAFSTNTPLFQWDQNFRFRFRLSVETN